MTSDSSYALPRADHFNPMMLSATPFSGLISGGDIALQSTLNICTIGVGAAVKSLKTQAQTPVVLKEPHPIQSATIVSARAMNLHLDSGSIEIGKRADLILVNGNPLKNISDIRKITRVVTNGRLYQSATLWAASGFRAIAK